MVKTIEKLGIAASKAIEVKSTPPIRCPFSFNNTSEFITSP